ncbi:MAG: PepSY-associated TM helix domain-containing protein [Bacteroidales bacterium]|nr:PepSY-associated TM helix domain-containing protein [Bacteroidales bacterium]
MVHESNRKRKASVLRSFRKVHRITASLLFLFFFVMATTGILLGIKKHSGEMIQAKTHQGTSTDFKEWLPMDSLYTNACQAFTDSVSTNLPAKVPRIDVRKGKGTVKFIFAKGFWGVQVDGATGNVLRIERRRSDFIEMLHDGSIVDYLAGSGGGLFKLIYTIVMGAALLLFTITGFWLWYGPKQMRRKKRE